MSAKLMVFSLYLDGKFHYDWIKVTRDEVSNYNTSKSNCDIKLEFMWHLSLAYEIKWIQKGPQDRN